MVASADAADRASFPVAGVVRGGAMERARQAAIAVAVIRRNGQADAPGEAKPIGSIGESVETVVSLKPFGNRGVPACGDLVDLDAVHQFVGHA